MTMSPRVFELGHEVRTRARNASELLKEYQAALEHHGKGVHRDPARVIAELGDELADLLEASGEADYQLERDQRGL
jgi:hypothetical protein